MTTSLHSRLSLKAALPTLLFLALSPGAAYAHVGIGATNGLIHGLLHPFIGLDHLLAMIAVGLWATQLGGRAVWFVPLSFVSIMALGGLLGMAGITLPFVEFGIFTSLLILGVLIAAAIRLPLIASAAIVSVFALFHGYAHGSEMPQAASSLNYALGFILATAALHTTGIILATWLGKMGRPQWLRLIGASIAMFGGALYFAG